MKGKASTRARTPLTHRLLETLQPETRAYRIPDARCVGLAVRVAPSGIVSFDLAYRISKSSKFRRLSLGKFGDISLENARNRANQLTMAARAGRDLIGDEEAERAASDSRPKVAGLIDEYASRRLEGRLRTAVPIEKRIRRALAPVVDQFAEDLRRRDIRRLLDAVADAGHPREAEQRRVALNGLFKWAVAQDHIETNPMLGLTSYGRSPARERVLDAAEIRILWEWFESCKVTEAGIDVLRLQLCLGARCSEVGGMHAEEFDTDRWLWMLPAERSKSKKGRATPIVGLAREIVTRRLAQTKGHLFLAATGRPLSSMNVGHLLLNNQPPIAKFGTHDLRRTVATMMAEALGISLETIARVIGHTAGTSTSTRTLVSHYLSSQFIPEKTNALLAWDARLRAIIAGKVETEGNVVSLAARSA